jgi:anhydro-N-acetylmuramic acid kinase
MAGTSQDGVDFAAVIFHKVDQKLKWEVAHCLTEPYSEEWSARLSNSIASKGEELAKLHTDYGHLLGLTLRKFILETGFAPEFVASHGATVFHQPGRHFTFQLGCGETTVSHLEVPLICNFRPRDVALGGEGAPLVPTGEKELFSDFDIFLNLGGIANISLHNLQRFCVTSWRQKAVDILGWDIAACNMTLNYLAQKLGQPYDKDGDLARKGSCNLELLKKLDELPYYSLIPPKTLGREWVNSEILPLLEKIPIIDSLHTYILHFVDVMRKELEKFAIRDSRILVTGGGAFNSFLIERLGAELKPLNIELVVPAPDIVAYKEAIIFAYLGLAQLQRIPNTIATVTGAKRSCISGSLHLPDNWRRPLLL